MSDAVSFMEGLDLHQLRSVWEERYGAPPKLRSRELLALMLAWRIQAQATGGLDLETRRSLRRPAGEKPKAQPTGGTRLVREWQGVRHEVVTVEGGGFLYRGQRFDSLSSIARQITGARWNGPRFFGLRPEGRRQ